MKLGAQFYTLRNLTQTEEGIRNCFATCKKIGYESVQLSAIGNFESEYLRDLSQEYGLPIACTHTALDRIIEDTDAVIREHKIYGSTVIGNGCLPEYAMHSLEGTREYIKNIREPLKKIENAGLHLAHHNHFWEFGGKEGVDYLDVMAEELPDLHFILDTYWLVYSGRDPLAYVERFGGERMSCLHLKDMSKDDSRAICPCGDGGLDFAKIVDAAKRAGISHCLVEQDNAPDIGDEWEQMTKSYNHLKSFF